MSGPSEAVRIAIAGSGAMSRYHAQRFGALNGVALAACYDRSIERATALAREFSVDSAYDDIGDLLDQERPDALSVATADSQHYELTAAAIKRAVPVFLEKPFTVDVVQAEHLVSLQQRYQVPIMVNFSKINYPAVWGLINAVDAGVVGQLRELELHYMQSWLISGVWGDWWRQPRWLWRISSSHGGGGALRDLGSHLVYLALRLAGDAASVSVTTAVTADRRAAGGSGYSCDMNDRFCVELGFTGGAVARIAGGYAEPGCINRVYVRAIGTRGSVEVSAEKEKGLLTLCRGARTREVKFAKVHSTYRAFVSGVGTAEPWQLFRPSARDGLAVQRLLSGVLA